jgi:hypothetical protein
MSGSKTLGWSFVLMLMVLICGMPQPACAESLQTKYEERLREIRLITSMESALYAAAEAEKLAVMADTDEASKAFADKARSLGDDIDKARNDLSSLVRQAKLNKEAALLAEFDSCWMQYRKLDAEILELAVKNTNLKAARLSQGQAMVLIQKFESSLAGIIPEGDDQQLRMRIQALKDQALLAVQRIQILHAPHIDEAGTEKMDAMEQEMKVQESQARKALSDIGSLLGAKGGEMVQAATSALDEYMKATAEIVALSRQNTNVDSLRLSLSNKRTITATCSETLEALKKAAFDRGFKATR